MRYNMQIGKLVQEGVLSIKTGPFGTQLKAAEYQESGTPVLNVKNLGFGSVSSAKLDHVGADTAERLQTHLLKQGDIVFGRKGAVDRHAYIDNESVGWMQGSDCIRLRVEVDTINSKFLSYYFLTNKHKAFMASMCSHGTTMASLNQKILEQIDFPCPERSYQNKVVDILGKFDEKIKVNQRINENLEQQAAAYFHHQFIANADPSWKEGAISDLGTVIGGSTPSKSKPEYYTDNGIAWITPKDLSVDKSKFISHGADDITELGLKNSSVTVMPAGTVLFSSRAPIGYIAIADCEVTTNQGFKSVVPNNNVGTAFVYFFLKNALSTIENMASGSTFKEISGSAMRTVPAIIPDNESLQEFADFCEPLFQQQRTLEAENRSLAALRDALLPKLMSGELDVSDLEF